MANTSYAALFKRLSDGRWEGQMLDIPAIVASGDTREDAARQLREAMGIYMEKMRQAGLKIPPPNAQIAEIEVSV
jgi:predicted RNase H-like HicB family nuclease